jgi:hypothetical protein
MPSSHRQSAHVRVKTESLCSGKSGYRSKRINHGCMNTLVINGRCAVTSLLELVAVPEGYQGRWATGTLSTVSEVLGRASAPLPPIVPQNSASSQSASNNVNLHFLLKLAARVTSVQVIHLNVRRKRLE